MGQQFTRVRRTSAVAGWRLCHGGGLGLWETRRHSRGAQNVEMVNSGGANFAFFTGMKSRHSTSKWSWCLSASRHSPPQSAECEWGTVSSHVSVCAHRHSVRPEAAKARRQSSAQILRRSAASPSESGVVRGFGGVGAGPAVRCRMGVDCSIPGHGSQGVKTQKIVLDKIPEK